MEIAWILIIGGIGVSLLFVGSLVSALTAIGNKQYIFGFGTLMFFPLSLVYCALNWNKASYPGKLVFSGAAICLISFVFIKVFIR
jgi:hypothetical protein